MSENTNLLMINNKIITLDQIIKITEYLRKIFNYYNDLIKQELLMNNNANFYSASYKHYAFTKPSLEYKIVFTDKKEYDVKDDYILNDILKKPQDIEKIQMRLYISYCDNDLGEKTDHNLAISLDFLENTIHFTTSNKNMNDELDKFSLFMNELLNNSEERFNKIIKKRFWVKTAIGLSAGSILTLIGFIILLLTRNDANETLNMFFDNPILLVLIGWLIAFAFGRVLVSPIMNGLYKGLEIGLENATYGGNYTNSYEDNYKVFNEVLIGKNCGNLEKRKSIEKTYAFCKKILLFRVLISIIIFIVLSFI